MFNSKKCFFILNFEEFKRNRIPYLFICSFNALMRMTEELSSPFLNLYFFFKLFKLISSTNTSLCVM